MRSGPKMKYLEHWLPNYDPQAKYHLLPVFVNSFVGTQSCPFTYVLSIIDFIGQG